MPSDPQSPAEPPTLPYATRRDHEPRRSLFVSCLIGAAIVALPVVLLLPSGLKSREITPRALCAANLRGIGQAAKVYANDNGDLYPPRLETLIDDGSCVPQQLVSPLSRHSGPACDYSYATGLTDNDPPDWIFAYGDPAYTKGEGANVLYLDGHVEYVREPKFSEELQRFKAAYEKARGGPPVVIPPH